MSNSVQPHRQQPTRLPRPWDSPGKNTGVGCHFLLQCMRVRSESEVAQSCPTLRNPLDCSPPGSSIHGIFPGKSTGFFSESPINHTLKNSYLNCVVCVCVCVCVCARARSVAQSCRTLHNTLDCSLPGCYVHGIFQARTLERVAVSFSRGSS